MNWNCKPNITRALGHSMAEWLARWTHNLETLSLSPGQTYV